MQPEELVNKFLLTEPSALGIQISPFLLSISEHFGSIEAQRMEARRCGACERVEGSGGKEKRIISLISLRKRPGRAAAKRRAALVGSSVPQGSSTRAVLGLDVLISSVVGAERQV